MNAYAIPTIVTIATLGLAALIWRRTALRGTTLVAPWCWSVLALLAVAGSELAIEVRGAGERPWAAVLRYAAATSTFCPAMAVLGAKRPQDRAWQFIVLSLWIVLVIPAGQWVLFGSGPLELHPAWSWFLLILVAAGTSNYLPTRFWPSSLLLGIAQLLWLSPLLPWSGGPAASDGSLCGLTLAVLAIVLASLGIWPARRSMGPIDRVWLDFRNAFGAVWGLRVAERINASSKMYGWGVRLAWQGLVASEGLRPEELPPAVESALRESLKMLLRRFVSPQWIAQRLEEPLE